jgi:hypothetical protein
VPFTRPLAGLILAAVRTQNRFAFDASGRVLVLFDGQEILVHGGDDESPRWKREVEAEPIGLAATGEAVVTLEAGGKITWWSVSDGEPLGSAASGKDAFALASARSAAVCVAVLPGGVEGAELGKDLRSLPFAGTITAAAVRDDGARIAVGSENGVVTIATGEGEVVGTSKLEGPVASLCFCPAGDGPGSWLATSADRVLRVGPGGGPPSNVTRAQGMTPDCVCTSLDGALFAVRLDAHTMIALALPPGENVVQLRYVDREVAGVAFGPGRRLGVGLLGGDGNIVDIPGKQLLRTDTFAGRKHNRWLVDTVIDPAAALPAREGAAGASADAPETEAPETEAPETEAPSEEAPQADPNADRFPSVWVGLAIVAIVAVVVILIR